MSKKLMLLINHRLANFKCQQAPITDPIIQNSVLTKQVMLLVRNLISNLRQIYSIICRIIKEGPQLGLVNSNLLHKSQTSTRSSKFMMVKKTTPTSTMLMATVQLITTMQTSSMMVNSLLIQMKTKVPNNLIENSNCNNNRNQIISNDSCRNSLKIISQMTTMRSQMARMKKTSTIFMGSRECLMTKMPVTSSMNKINS